MSLLLQNISLHSNFRLKAGKENSLPQKFSGHWLSKVVVLLAIISTRNRREKKKKRRKEKPACPKEALGFYVFVVQQEKNNFHTAPHILCLHKRKQVYHVSCFYTQISNCFPYLGIPHGSRDTKQFPSRHFLG